MNRGIVFSFRTLIAFNILLGIAIEQAKAQSALDGGSQSSDAGQLVVAPTEANSNEVAPPRVDNGERLKHDLSFLASDELRGRGVGDDGIHRAALYIADRLREIGLDTTSIEGSGLQPFDVVLGARPTGPESNRLTVIASDDSIAPISVELNDGFSPMAVGNASGQLEGALFFAGYGITAPDLNYDEYEGFDASGKIALILRKEPQAADAKSRFAGNRNTQHAFFATKIENAVKHGAVAVVLVNDQASVQQAVQQVQEKIARETQRRADTVQQIDALPAEAENSRTTLRLSLQGIDASIDGLNRELQQAQRGILGISEAGRLAQGTESIPVVSVARDLVSQWIESSSGKSLEQLEQEIDSSGTPRSLILDGITMELKMELEPLQAATNNVIGVLPGRGELAEETVVVGAHYDHVGMGGEGSLAPGTIAVHNGADDNASGTTALLASAERIRDRLADQPSHRRVMFIAFSAEERGLLGSKHYVRNPRFPLENTVAMVNLDMVGRLRDNELTVYGTGSSPKFDELVENANALLAEPFRLFKVATGYGPSDHQSFYEAGIPVLFFFTGLHNDYHRPSDDVEKIDFEGLDRVTEIVAKVTVELATRSERPEYAKTDNRVEIRRQLTAFLGVSLGDRGDHVVITSVADGGPAAKGGLRVSDRLEKVGDQVVGSSQQVIDWVRRKSPGDRAKIVVNRSGETLEMIVELSQRPE